MAAQALAAMRFPAVAALMPRVSCSTTSPSNIPEPSSSSASSPVFCLPSSSPFSSSSAIAGHLLARGTGSSFGGFRSPVNEDASSSSTSMEAFEMAVNPTLAYADTLNFRGTFNAQIIVGENESVESVVRRFRRAVMQAGVIAECRRRRFHETPQDVRKRKEQSSRRRRTRGKVKKAGGMRPGGGMDGGDKPQEAGWGFEITDEGERWESDES